MPRLTFEVPNDVILLVTPDEFAAIAAVNQDLRLERSAKGELIVTPPAGGESGRRNIKIGRFLDEWADQYGGVCFDSSSGFVLLNGATRSPGASWISRDRISRNNEPESRVDESWQFHDLPALKTCSAVSFKSGKVGEMIV